MADRPQDQWLWKFRERWLKDAFDATVALRLDEWELANDESLAQVAAWTREAAAAHQEELNFAVLEGVMRLLVRTMGDPPADAAMRAAAHKYLVTPPDDELVAATERLVREMLPNLDSLLEGVRAQLGDTALVQARLVLAVIGAWLALPRVELLRVSGRLSRLPDGAADPFGEAFQAGIDCAGTDPGRSESFLLQALELAGQVRPPGDRFLVVRTLLHRPGGRLRPGTLRACARQLRELAPAGLDGDKVAREIGRASMQANAAGLAPELFPVLAEADETVLAGELSATGRIIHGLEVAQWWLRIGRFDRCDLALSRLRQKSGAVPAALLGAAGVEAEMRRLCSDRSSARRILTEALQATEGGSGAAEDRAKAVIQLIACWPVDTGSATWPVARFRPEPLRAGKLGLPGWFAEAGRLISASPPRVRNNLRVSLLGALHAIGAAEQAELLSASVDLAAFRAQSPDYAEWTVDLEAWMERRSADEQGNEPPPGDAGQTYADLAAEGRYHEAAVAADAQAATEENRGFRVNAYDTLIRSAQLHVLTGDWAAALGAYDHAFALLEQDLRYLPYVELVVRRLVAWPNLYQQAAVVAIRLGDPVRAVSLAETGRARATSSRLGRAHSLPPAGVAQADWQRFTHLWRRAIADAASELFAAGDEGPAQGDSTGATRLARPTACADEINQLRRAFLDAGVAPEVLAPVAPPADIAEIPARLATADLPTAVLYPIQIPGNIHFVRIAAAGAAEIPLVPGSGAEVARAIEKFGADVRSVTSAGAAARHPLRDLLAGLVRDLGPHLEPVMSEAVAGVEDGRLIWVPQGAEVTVPIQALPCRTGQVIDLVSVIVAASLRTIADAVADDVAQPLRAVVVEGPAEPGQASTDGGDRVLLCDGVPPPVMRPASLAEVNAAIATRTLVHLSCHGHFHWADPLSSALQLGADSQHRFDLPVADVFDAVSLPADALVLLGVCDSGTIAQTDLNEGIGVPAAFLAAGTRAVIGAGWPVARGVAVGVCIKFMAALRAGHASPEALRLAAIWMRDATISDLDLELAAINHPLFRGEPATAEQAALRRRRVFTDPSFWASYVHWGGGWRIESP